MRIPTEKDVNAAWRAWDDDGPNQLDGDALCDLYGGPIYGCLTVMKENYSAIRAILEAKETAPRMVNT